MTFDPCRPAAGASALLTLRTRDADAPGREDDLPARFIKTVLNEKASGATIPTDHIHILPCRFPHPVVATFIISIRLSIRYRTTGFFSMSGPERSDRPERLQRGIIITGNAGSRRTVRNTETVTASEPARTIQRTDASPTCRPGRQRAAPLATQRPVPTVRYSRTGGADGRRCASCR